LFNILTFEPVGSFFMPKIPVNLLQRQKREYERLTEIYGNCPKYVITADEFSGATYDGIKTVNIADLPWSAVVQWQNQYVQPP
jgi:hypothetical protein